VEPEKENLADGQNDDGTGHCVVLLLPARRGENAEHDGGKHKDSKTQNDWPISSPHASPHPSRTARINKAAE
jgi:hypothetical protein